jgi:hypothetical protein
MTLVEFWEIKDKQGQQRLRRTDGAVWSVADRSAVEEDRCFAAQVAQKTQGRLSVNPEPSCRGGDFVDSPQWGSLAGRAREIPASLEVPAETMLAKIRVGRSHRAGLPRQKPVRAIANKERAAIRCAIARGKPGSN